MLIFIEPIEPSKRPVGLNSNDELFNQFVMQLGKEMERVKLGLEPAEWTKLIVALRNTWGVNE